MTLLVDTREQPTERLQRRIDDTGLPHIRQKLDYGDYSCQCLLPDGKQLDFSSKVVIERKMDIGELCTCFGRARARFEQEFERARADGCRVYLLVENGNWEKVYTGKYRSQMKPKALIASINAFRARYGMQFDFCRDATTGQLIRDILYRELKNYLEGCE
ncbi:ERCC4 domain-containing protein [Lachnospiraceae bacterium ASD4241]|uniref:ERCC4 domain-containing protein n=2 Tax=Diplocloster modestus TaxID=2850322 RepID=A0ABS6KC30_9FIRM|nr:ERCC4 domain-containing protein [Diplocloster modestus]